MRVLVLGATGLIGSAVAARLRGAGHEVVGAARRLDPAARRVPVGRWALFDLRAMTRAEDWAPQLAGIDAVVNCAGVLQDNVRDSTSAVHAEAPAALWRACERAGVRRVIQLSAIGVNRGGATAFSRTKQAADSALESTRLHWVILRPSIVVGRAAYGGSALFRALASLPVLPRVPDSGSLDIVQLDDVAETVERLLRPGAPSRMALDLAGPERLGFADVVAADRRWLGWPPARELRVPRFLMSAAWRIGDLIARFGWRPPIRTTARRELVRGATGDNRDWIRLTGIAPRSLGEALAAHPSTVQERWFARLYLLKPLAIGTFALFWLATGLVALGPGWDRAVQVMETTAAARWAEPAVVGGAALDLIIGAALLFRRTARPALLAAIAASLLYLLLGTLLIPSLWADPLGPMLKMAPLLVLNLLCLAILDER